MNYKQRSPDNVYYNVVITNNTDVDQLAQFSETRSDDIVSYMEDYHLSIVKFAIPTSEIPIIQTFPVGATATSQSSGYSITLGVSGGTASQQFLQYVPIDSTGNSWIFNYSQITNMINTAFTSASTAIGATGTPYMVFNNTSQLFSLYVPTSYTAQNINIWFNTQTASLFPSFPYNYYNPVSFSFLNSGEYARMPIIENPSPDTTGATGYYQIIEEYASTVSLYEARAIRFVSSLVPIRHEAIPIASSSNTQGTNANSQPIMTDFDLPLNSISDIKPFVQYFPQGPYRLIDIKSQGSVRQFDLSVFWVDAIGNLNPLFIPPTQSLTVKFLFQNKTISNRY